MKKIVKGIKEFGKGVISPVTGLSELCKRIKNEVEDYSTLSKGLVGCATLFTVAATSLVISPVIVAITVGGVALVSSAALQVNKIYKNKVKKAGAIVAATAIMASTTLGSIYYAGKNFEAKPINIRGLLTSSFNNGKTIKLEKKGNAYSMPKDSVKEFKA